MCPSFPVTPVSDGLSGRVGGKGNTYYEEVHYDHSRNMEIGGGITRCLLYVLQQLRFFPPVAKILLSTLVDLSGVTPPTEGGIQLDSKESHPYAGPYSAAAMPAGRGRLPSGHTCPEGR